MAFIRHMDHVDVACKFPAVHDGSSLVYDSTVQEGADFLESCYASPSCYVVRVLDTLRVETRYALLPCDVNDVLPTLASVILP